MRPGNTREEGKREKEGKVANKGPLQIELREPVAGFNQAGMLGVRVAVSLSYPSRLQESWSA